MGHLSVDHRGALSRSLYVIGLALALVILGANITTGDDSLALTRSHVEALILEGNFREGEAKAQRWLETAERTNDDLAIAEALDALTRIYAGLRRYQDAETIWRRCLDLRIRRLGPKHSLVARTIDVMTGIYYEQGRAAEAKVLWRDALTAYEKRPPIATIESIPKPDLTKEAPLSALIRNGRLNEAESLLRRNGDIPGLAAFLLDRNRASEALTLHRQLVDAAPTAERAINIAALYRQRDLYSQEEEFLQRALAIQKKNLGSSNVELVSTLMLLADSYAKQNQTADAYAVLRQAATVATAVRLQEISTVTPLTALRLREPYMRLLKAASVLSRNEPERQEELINETFRAGQLVTETALNVITSQVGIRLSKGTGALAQIIRQRQDDEAGLHRLDKRLLQLVAAEDSTQIEKDTTRREIANLAKQISEADIRLNMSFPQYYSFASGNPLDVSEARSLLRDDEALVQFAFLNDQSYAWVITKTSAKWTIIPKSQSDIETSVAELRCGLDYWGGWRSERCSKLTNRVYSEADHRAIKPLPFDLLRAHEVYNLLFGVFENAIANKNLLIVLSGPLSSLPPQVLVTQRPSAQFPADWSSYSRAAWLIKTHAITVLPSAASLRAFRFSSHRSSAPRAYIAFANPLLTGRSGTDRRALRRRTCTDAVAMGKIEGGPTARGPLARYFSGNTANIEAVRALDPLVETADEVCGVSRELNGQPSDVFLAGDATEQKVKDLSSSGTLQNYRIVHFATHGLVASEAEIIAGGFPEPALVLTPPKVASVADDGLLTASEIAQLKLGADWVILSACNTASPDHAGAEALSGLAKSFFYAGARALLVSHWSVDNDATLQLITGIFRNLTVDASVGRAQALRKAMVGMINEGDSPAAHPAYWGPFTMVGEGTEN
jgi:CHAT domain-containing protein/tetratricopeptide (TPR) repeat protein